MATAICHKKSNPPTYRRSISTKTTDIFNLTKWDDLINNLLQNGKYKQYIQPLKTFPYNFSTTITLFSQNMLYLHRAGHFITHTAIHLRNIKP